jgi:dTMP kinase
VENLIAPALKEGKIVLLDRYFYSTIAYQGSRGANVAEVKSLMEARFPVPDAVFILDIEADLSAYRIAHIRGEEPNHFEERANLSMAREIFNAMLEPNIFRIDGAMSRHAVHQEIVSKFIEAPLKAKRCAKQYGCDDPFHCVSRITGTCEWFRIQGELRSASEVIA